MRLVIDTRFFLIVLAFIALFWLLRSAGSVVLPFIVGAFLAVLLEPFARRLAAIGLGQTWSALAMTFLALIVIVGPIAAVTPILVIEGAALTERLPALADNVARRIADLAMGMGLQPPDMSVAALLEEYNPVQAVGARLGGSISGALTAILFILLTPVATFFFLKDWPHVTETISGLVPRAYAAKVRTIAAETNQQLARYVRGQALVVLVQSAYYAIGLTAVGLNYAIAIGILTGISSIVPVLGNLTMFILALLVALNQYESIWPVLIVVAIYGAAQLLETLFLAPRLVGDALKLHPLWIIAALLFGGAIFGLLGALLALPAAAAISVLAKHGLAAYRDSTLYRGADDAPAKRTKRKAP